MNSVNDTSGSATITVKVAEGSNYLAGADKSVAVKAQFREYLYGFDINLNDSNPQPESAIPAMWRTADLPPAKMKLRRSVQLWQLAQHPGTEVHGPSPVC